MRQFDTIGQLHILEYNAEVKV